MRSVQHAVPNARGLQMGNLAIPTVFTGTWNQHLTIKHITIQENEVVLDLALLNKLESLQNEPVMTYSSFEEVLSHLNNLKRS